MKQQEGSGVRGAKNPDLVVFCKKNPPKKKKKKCQSSFGERRAETHKASGNSSCIALTCGKTLQFAMAVQMPMMTAMSRCSAATAGLAGKLHA